MSKSSEIFYDTKDNAFKRFFLLSHNNFRRKTFDAVKKFLKIGLLLPVKS